MSLLNDILTQRLDRREFFIRVGAGLLVLTGATAFLKTLSEGTSPKSDAKAANTYGASVYGGSPASRPAPQRPRQLG